METRFGVKDFILFVVLGIVILMIGLAMVQFDRQWDQVQTINSKLEQQANDLQSIRRQLENGVALNSTTQPTTADIPVAQQRIEAARQMPNFADGDWFIYGVPVNFSSLTPFIGGDAYSADVLGNVQESLCQRDPITLDWQGLLAESWTIDDNTKAWNAYADKRRAVPLTEAEITAEPDCPDNSKPADRQAYIARRMKEGRTDDNIGAEKDCPPAATFIYKMRKNATFSDGTPVTPDDVVFTFNFTMNPDVAAPRERSGLHQIRAVKQVGDDSVAFIFAVPYFDSMSLAGEMAVMPRHFYEKFKPQDYNQSTGLVMGSGPYMMADPTGWKPGTQVELIRNPRYWGVAPAFAKLVYREFTNSVALETAFRNGEIDQIGCTPDRYIKLLHDQKILDRTQHFEYQSSTGGYGYVAWNQMRDGKPTKFADKRVRQALTMLIDQKRLIAEVLLNLAAPATGPFNPASKQVDPAIKPYPFDPQRAMQLLADAGWKDRGSGILTNDAGEAFDFKLTYPSGSPTYDKMVLLLKDFFAAAKIRLEPDAQEFSVFGDRLKNRAFDAISLAWTAGIENDIYQMFDSSQMADGGDDFMSYRNPELDHAIETARRTLDESARMKLWHQCHDIIYEDQPYTFLYFPKSLVFMDKRISNVQKLPLGLNPDSEWFVPKNEQRWTK